MDSAGGCAVVWADGYDIRGERYDSAGLAVGDEFLAGTNTSAFPTKPAVAIDACGGLVLIWQSYEHDPSDYVIRGRRYDASGTAVGAEFQVGSAGTDRQYNPAVAVDPAGGFLVIWEGRNLSANFADYSGIFAQRYDASGRPLGEELQINGDASYFAVSPAMAMDSAGNLVVVWAGDSADRGGGGIFARRYDAAGRAFGAEIQISESSTEAQFAPAVATDDEGGFVVVWQRAAFFVSQVVGRRYDSGGMPVGDVFRVTADAGYTNAFPTVAALPGGDFVVVWERDDLSQLFVGPGDIVAQQYLSSGDPVGGALRVNHVVAGHQGTPAVTADATGHLVVAWLDLAGIESEGGIFARHYSVSSADEGTECAGDCDSSHRVTVAELVRSIKLVLDDAPLDACPAADANGDGRMTITDLLSAVDDALHGCH
jgi:hypothetical protein